MPRIDPPSPSFATLPLQKNTSQSGKHGNPSTKDRPSSQENLSSQYDATGAPLSKANLQKRPGWANNTAEQTTKVPSLCPAGMPWTAESKAAVTLARFVDTTGQPFVTLDSVEVLKARCANELLLEAVKKCSLPISELFVMSPPSSRDTVKVGNNFSGEWFTNMRLGKNVEIGNDVNLLGHGFIELHDNVKLGSDVSIITIGHPNDPELRHTAFTGSVVIQEGAQIGAGTILSQEPARHL